MPLCNACEDPENGCELYCVALRGCELAGVEQIGQSGWEPWMGGEGGYFEPEEGER